MGSCWENDDGTISIVKTEIEDIDSAEYDENGESLPSEFISNENNENIPENEIDPEARALQEDLYFKQEGVDTGEDMEYRMESYEDGIHYPENYPVEEEQFNTNYEDGLLPPDPGQEFMNLPGTSDMSAFADARVEKLYPCNYCDYVGSHPKLLRSHLNNRHIKAIVYQCPHCIYNSTIPRSTKDHIETKHYNEDDRPMEIKRKCQFCEYSASNATALKNHMNKHTREKQHQCSYCDFNTLWLGYLKMHIRRKHSEQSTETGYLAKEYPCQYCDYKAATPSTLKLHTNKHTRELEHQCPYCPYKTVWTTYIKLHIKNKHLKPEKSPITKEHACSFCEYKAKNTTLLKQHLNKHTREKVHQCPHCPFTTLWMTYMKLHIKRKHTENTEGDTSPAKEFPCQYCSYKAISSSHLKIHENKHTKAIEYKCEQCNFKTTWYGYLKLHTKRKHSIKQENPTTKTTYPCKFCSYKAVNLSTLKVHQNKHTREVLYTCPHCEFKTTWRAYIKMHIAKHKGDNFKTRKQKILGVRSYPCQYCDYAATQLGALKLHVNSKHTRNEIHKCPKCEYQCTVYGNLKMHIKRRHGLKPDPDGKYHCKECEFQNENANDFKIHLLEKHDIKMDIDDMNKEEDKIFSCQYCAYQTFYPQVMKKHINKHTRQNVIQCPHCPYKTVWGHYMKVHIRRHNEPKTGRKRFSKPNTDLSRSFPCQFCDHRSLSFSSLKDHINSVHTRAVLHKCPYCDHMCTLKGNLKGHIRRKHPTEYVENEKKYPCGHCEFNTSVLRNLKIHLKREHNVDDTKVKAENGEFKCQYCEYKARSYYSLKIHLNKHTKEFSYHCPHCEFVTRWPNYLRKHIKQHSITKCRVSCLYCDYKGCSTFRLRQHIESQHKVDQHYPCPKPNCEFRTIHYTSLRIHLKGSIHASDKPKSYMSVTRNFCYKYNSNEGRYFACDFCDYASKTQGNLDLHIKNKHDKRVTLRCSFCHYRTPSKSYLNRHMKVKHLIKTKSDDDVVKTSLYSQQDHNKACLKNDTTVKSNTEQEKDDVSFEDTCKVEETEEDSPNIRCKRKRSSIPSYVEQQSDEDDECYSDIEIKSENDLEIKKASSIIALDSSEVNNTIKQNECVMSHGEDVKVGTTPTRKSNGYLCSNDNFTENEFSARNKKQDMEESEFNEELLNKLEIVLNDSVETTEKEEHNSYKQNNESIQPVEEIKSVKTMPNLNLNSEITLIPSSRLKIPNRNANSSESQKNHPVLSKIIRQKINTSQPKLKVLPKRNAKVKKDDYGCLLNKTPDCKKSVITVNEVKLTVQHKSSETQVKLEKDVPEPIIEILDDEDTPIEEKEVTNSLTIEQPSYLNSMNYYVCPHCTYKTKRQNLFDVHIQKHTYETLKHCSYCTFDTLSSAHLKLHLKRKHSKNGNENKSKNKEMIQQSQDGTLSQNLVETGRDDETALAQHKVPGNNDVSEENSSCLSNINSGNKTCENILENEKETKVLNNDPGENMLKKNIDKNQDQIKSEKDEKSCFEKISNSQSLIKNKLRKNSENILENEKDTKILNTDPSENILKKNLVTLNDKNKDQLELQKDENICPENIEKCVADQKKMLTSEKVNSNIALENNSTDIRSTLNNTKQEKKDLEDSTQKIYSESISSHIVSDSENAAHGNATIINSSKDITSTIDKVVGMHIKNEINETCNNKSNTNN